MTKRRKIMIGAIIAISLIVIIVLVILPPSSGKMPRCEFENGISERTDLTVDNGKLTLMLKSNDVSNPVLMVCGGGPGIPQYLLENNFGSPLSEKFTVCYWDYRGTGASYSSDIKPEDMTADRYLKDAIAVTDYLSKRFSQEKIYVMGHSFGSYIAAKIIQAHPEKYKCYIAMSQICRQKDSEILAFDYMKRRYEEMGNKSMAEQFQKYDIAASEEDYSSYFSSELRDKAMHDLGVGTTRDMKSVITGIFFPSLRCTTYTQGERINLWKGKAMTKKFPVVDNSVRFNAFEEVPSVEIPVYFIAGKYDYTCCTSLQQEYYEYISAPKKQIFIFDNSAHSPLYEEHERGREVLEEIINSIENQG